MAKGRIPEFSLHQNSCSKVSETSKVSLKLPPKDGKYQLPLLTKDIDDGTH